MNVITIAGYVASDPKLNQTPSGTNVLNLRIPVKNPFKEDATLWFSASLFGKKADSLSNIIRKGTYVIVTGRLDASPYTDNSGNLRPGLKINVNDITLGPKTNSQPSQPPQPTNDNPYDFNDSDDNLPF